MSDNIMRLTIKRMKPFYLQEFDTDTIEAEHGFTNSYNRVGGASGEVGGASASGISLKGAKQPRADLSKAPLRCIVGELATLMLNSISEAKYKSTQIHILSTVRLVGVCCCLQPERIVAAIVPSITQFSPAVRNFALDTLTSILLDQFQVRINTTDLGARL